MKQKILILLGVILMAVSCTFEPLPIGSGRRVYKAYFQKTLTDPSSLKIYEEKYRQVGDTVFWSLDIGARNSFGAMVRNQYTLMTISDYYLFVLNTGSSYSKEDLEDYMYTW